MLLWGSAEYVINYINPVPVKYQFRSQGRISYCCLSHCHCIFSRRKFIHDHPWPCFNLVIYLWISLKQYLLIPIYRSLERFYLSSRFWTKLLSRCLTLKLSNKLPTLDTNRGDSCGSNLWYHYLSQWSSLKFYINIIIWCAIRRASLSSVLWTKGLS